MKIGIPKEIKPDENRVAITPAGVRSLTEAGHRVAVEKGAGLGSSIKDEQYERAGAELLDSLEDAYAFADLVMKVKEPLEREYACFREGLAIFTYLHLAADERLARRLAEAGVTAVGYETIQLKDGSLPLLIPMSEVAGRMAIQVGAQCLEWRNGGRGILLSGIPGVPPAEVVVLGGGIVGFSAAKIAVGLGAQVTVIDRSIPKLRYIDEVMSGRVITVCSNPDTIERAAKYADLIIGAALIVGAKAPTLVTESVVKIMKERAAIVDVAIDQGGCVETSRATTHSEPTYVAHGVLHYCVGNMPAAVPRTSTIGLTNVTLPYALDLANKGVDRAVKEDPALALGVNVRGGEFVHPALKELFG